MNTAGLSTDQAPPLAVPLGWHVGLPIAFVAGGAWLAVGDGPWLASGWQPTTVAVAHVGTLGAIGAVMAGSLYQMVPVVAGAPVPWPRLAHAVALLWGSGVAAFAVGFAGASPGALGAATWLLATAVVLFTLPVGWALARAPARTPTVWGMRLALVALAGAAAIGVRLLWGHAHGDLPAERQTWLMAHIALAVIGWVGGLIGAVSWQIVPMFWLTASPPSALTRWHGWLVAASLVSVAAAASAGASPQWVALSAAPGAAAVWLAQPLALARLLRARRRKLRDPTLVLWWLSIGAAPAVLVAAVAAVFMDWPAAAPLFGWIAVVGWAGAAVHGSLVRIVSFLWWFHRFTETADDAELQSRVPPMRQLWPDARVKVALALHAAALALGAAGIAGGQTPTVRSAGALLCACGFSVGFGFFGAWWRMRVALGGALPIRRFARIVASLRGTRLPRRP